MIVEPEDNPFATRHVRPGALVYRGHDGQPVDLAPLLDRLGEPGRKAQIVGPHGSGKSTLLAALTNALRERGRDVRMHVIADAAPDVARLLGEPGWSRDSLVVVDGAERLSWLARQRLAWKLWRSGAGLLATTHADLGWPTLWETRPTWVTMQAVVADLLAERPQRLDDGAVRRSFERHRGNFREALFDLYDQYERRRGRSTPR